MLKFQRTTSVISPCIKATYFFEVVINTDVPQEVPNSFLSKTTAAPGYQYK